ncbi:MAG: hypothetical protein HC888_04085 [Candidatus Competibacteraceae bacterium]|nr:hypothetical protein [Candidatus Competibacteraceae bacterium]
MSELAGDLAVFFYRRGVSRRLALFLVILALVTIRGLTLTYNVMAVLSFWLIAAAVAHVALSVGWEREVALSVGFFFLIGLTVILLLMGIDTNEIALDVTNIYRSGEEDNNHRTW